MSRRDVPTISRLGTVTVGGVVVSKDVVGEGFRGGAVRIREQILCE